MQVRFNALCAFIAFDLSNAQITRSRSSCIVMDDSGQTNDDCEFHATFPSGNSSPAYCSAALKIHFLAQIARIASVFAGQEADDWVPSTLCVIFGCGDFGYPTQTAETITSVPPQVIVHPAALHLSGPRAVIRKTLLPGGPIGPGGPAIPRSP